MNFMQSEWSVFLVFIISGMILLVVLSIQWARGDFDIERETSNLDKARKILKNGTCYKVIECKNCPFGTMQKVTCPKIVRGTQEGMKIVQDYLDGADVN